MASNSPWISAKQPIRDWNKRLEFDFRAYFEAMSHAVVHGVTGNWEGLAKDAVDGIKSLGIERDAGQLAWLLIRRALTQATFDLVRENAPQMAKKAPKNSKDILNKLDLSLEDAEIEISPTFFDRPSDLPVLALFRKPFTQWLMSYDLVEAQANSLADRLPSYFVFALIQEWRQRAEVYAPITESMATPFTAAGEREQGWDYYYAWLRKQADESVFSETFSLSQVYVPLRACYEIDGKEGSPESSGFSKRQKPRRVIDLQAQLDTWVNKADKGDAIRVISGGPGCGKSSFTRMYAAHLTHEIAFRVLYIPLHQFDLKGDLVSGVYDFVRKADLLPHNPLDSESPESRLLLIFDGLDELSMQGKVGADTVREFIDHVERIVNQYNYQHLRLQVLLSGREVVVQANESKFRKDTQILHILPYFLPDHERRTYDDPQTLLEADQRQLWWQKYGAAAGKPFEGMPQELRRRDLVEITAQPLLNYLVALIYTRGELDFSAQINLNIIYENLLKAVYERDYEDVQHPGARDLPLDDFILILEEIGLATWHGDGRTTTITEVHQQCIAAGLAELLEAFREGAEAGVARLLTAFYFRQHDERWQGERTFEFTHKSFGEYLTARRIIRALDLMHSELMRRKSRHQAGWDESLCLKHWAEIYGDAPRMTRDLFRFVAGEIAQIFVQDSERITAWQHMLSRLIDWMLRYGMPMELLNPRRNYWQENVAAIRAEEALLAALYACAAATEQVSQIPWFQESPTVVGEWLSRLQGQRLSDENMLALRCLGLLNMQNCVLIFKDLQHAELHHVNFEEAKLVGANLERANLVGASLKRASLEGAYLMVAILESANLQEAALAGTTLTGTFLARANLERAYLVAASLEGAYLVGANLVRANLEGASLKRARFDRASLEGASLAGASLEGASLAGANLEGVNLARAILPDGNKWTSDTDMARFTDPQHPNFWRSDDPISPAYRRDEHNKNDEGWDDEGQS